MTSFIAVQRFQITQTPLDILDKHDYSKPFQVIDSDGDRMLWANTESEAVDALCDILYHQIGSMDFELIKEKKLENYND